MAEVPGTNGADHQFASAKALELVDVSSTDHSVVIGGGIAMAMYCDTAGEILKIDMPAMTVPFTTLALQAGWNQISCTKIYKVGSTIAGGIMLGVW